MEKKDSRLCILVAAKKEFALKGYDGARLVEIAENAGVPQALIHYYFHTKEGLYVAVLEWLHEKKNDLRFFDYIASVPLTHSQRLYATLYYMTQLMTKEQDPDIWRIMTIEISTGHRHMKSIVDKFVLPLFERIEEVIARGVRDGEFEHSDPFLVVANLVSFMASYQQHLPYYKGTRIASRVNEKSSGSDSLDRMSRFVIYNTFKSLAPGRDIPEVINLPLEVALYIDKIIDSFPGSGEDRGGK